jgi:phospholipid/cholesterol/gamma-HCH transport system substrate-binding protein
MKSAAQVGVLVIVAFVLFAAGVAVVSRSFGEKTDSYIVVMPDAGGLAKGSKVLMAGVQVGEVTEVGLNGPQQARLKIGLKEGTHVPLSTRALVSTSLVGLGDPPMTLVQDPAYHGAAGDFPPGGTIEGGKAGPLDSILPNGGTELYTEMTETLKSVRKLLADDKLQGGVRDVLATTKQTMETSQETLRAFTKLATRGESLVGQNQAQIAAIIRTAEKTLVAVQGTAETIERFAKGGHLQKGADTLLADAHSIAQQSKAILVDLRRTINDPDLNANARATLSNVKETTAKLPGLVDQTTKVATNVADLTAKSQELPGKLGTVLDKAADLEERLGGLVGKFGGVLDRKPKGLPLISTEIDLLRQTDPGYWRTDLSLTVPTGDGFVAAGLWDAFNRNRVTLQYGTSVNSTFGYRYGIYAGRPGVGVDYKLAPRLGVRTDLWDINDPRFDARLRYEFGGGLVGWLGVDRIFAHPSLTIGVGVRH